MPRVRSGGGAHIDPRLADTLDSVAFFPSRIDIFEKASWVGETPSGAEVQLDEPELGVALLSDIHCQIAPIQRPGVGERRLETGTLEESSHLILVPAVLEDVRPHMIGRTIEGEVYDLLTRDIDYEGMAFTRMEARMIFPAAIQGV